MPTKEQLNELYNQIKQLESEANTLDMKGEYIKSNEKTRMRDMLQAQYTNMQQEMLKQQAK